MVSFSKVEIKDLSIAIVVITLLFAYLFSAGGSVGGLIILIPLSFITVGISFILHELAHKFTAQKYGFFAEFRKWNMGLVIAVISSLFGFVFLAPGAVYITSYMREITDKENGIISLAVPVVNIILAGIFYVISVAINPIAQTSIWLMYLALICSIGFNVNSFLAFFNLLPIPPFDGSKVFKWNKIIWIIAIGVSVILMLNRFI